MKRKGISRGYGAKKRLTQNVFYHKEKKKKDSQTFPTLKIFVL